MLSKEYYDLVNHNLLNPSTQLPKHKIPNQQFSGLKILGLVADWSACGYYRVILPLNLMEQMGAQVKVTSVCSYPDIIQSDLIIAPRQHKEEIKGLLTEALWMDKTVIFEIDDDLNHLSPNNPAFSVYHTGTEELKNIDKIMQSCSGVTVSTVELGKWYRKNNRNVAVVQNCIDFSQRNWSVNVDWTAEGIKMDLLNIPRPPDYGERVIIGYSCGNTHAEDFALVASSISKILQRNPNAAFAIYSSPPTQEKFAGQIKSYDKAGLIQPSQIIFLPARHFLDHPIGLQGMDIQIGPLVVNQFNLAKSDLKFLEASAAGAAFVGTSCAPYARAHKESEGKLLLVGAGSECQSSWVDAIEYLIRNPDRRKQLAHEARVWTIQNRSLENNITKWFKAWEAIRGEVLKGEVGPPDKSLPNSEYIEFGKYGRNDKCPIDESKKYKACYPGAWG